MNPPDVDGGAGSTDASDGAPSGCTRLPKEADRVRKVIASHPFLAAGTKGKGFEVLDLDVAGALTRTGTKFEMGTALNDAVVFTPDGEIGLVAQDDGTVGIFRFDPSGKPVVVNPALKGEFYAGRLVMDPSGARAYVLDANTESNKGGIYTIEIGCDGTVTPKGLIGPGGTANAMQFLPGAPTKALLAAGKAFASAAGTDTHVVDLGANPSLVQSGTAFSGHDAIPSSVAIMKDGMFALVSDDGAIAGNRVAVVALPSLTFVQMLTTEFPAAVVASAHGNAALVLNDDSTDEVTVLSYNSANANAPFAIKGRVPYKFPKPQIPVTAVQITRGSLAGRVIIGENTALRQMQFMPDGTVVDTAQTSTGTTIPDIVGVVGVQP